MTNERESGKYCNGNLAIIDDDNLSQTLVRVWQTLLPGRYMTPQNDTRFKISQQLISALQAIGNRHLAVQKFLSLINLQQLLHHNNWRSYVKTLQEAAGQK